MPTFYQRPLTWLLVGGLAALDLLLLGGVLPDRWVFAGAIVFGQMVFLTWWCVFGGIHWLWRVLGLIATIPFTAWLMLQWLGAKFTAEDWNELLAISVLLVSATLLGVGTTLLVKQTSSFHNSSRKRWRFSLGEILALTLIVAIGTWSLKSARIAEMFQEDESSFWLVCCYFAGVVLAIGTGSPQQRRSFSLLVFCLTLFFVPLAMTQFGWGRDALLVGFVFAAGCQLILTFDPVGAASNEILKD